MINNDFYFHIYRYLYFLISIYYFKERKSRLKNKKSSDFVVRILYYGK